MRKRGLSEYDGWILMEENNDMLTDKEEYCILCSDVTPKYRDGFHECCQTFPEEREEMENDLIREYEQREEIRCLFEGFTNVD